VNNTSVTAATKQLMHQIHMDISGIWLFKSTVKILLLDLHLPKIQCKKFFWNLYLFLFFYSFKGWFM